MILFQNIKKQKNIFLTWLKVLNTNIFLNMVKSIKNKQFLKLLKVSFSQYDNSIFITLH